MLARSGGVLLYAYHFTRALDVGVFPDPTSLPDGSQFYPEYLRKLRARVGDQFFENVYLPALLLLSAVRRPVTLTQLRDWGISEDRLQFALFDIADFLRVHRARGWHDSLSTEEENRYELAHEAFVRYVSEDSELRARLRETHAGVARSALNRWSGRWREADPTDDGDLYDLRYVPHHLREAGMAEQEAVLRADEEYASACWDAGNLAQKIARHRIAIDLYDQTAAVYRHLMEDEGRIELANDLASALVNRGSALDDLGRLSEAVEAFDEAIVIRRRLVESGRTEIANDLASALMNKVRVLEKLELWDDALACYEESIRWRERCVEAGMLHLLPELLRTIRFRVMTLLDLGRLQGAGSDVARLMEHVYVKLSSESPPQPVLEEIGWMLRRLWSYSPSSAKWCTRACYALCGIQHGVTRRRSVTSAVPSMPRVSLNSTGLGEWTECAGVFDDAGSQYIATIGARVPARRAVIGVRGRASSCCRCRARRL
ncbi:MAG: tetratricopeptide repeat protein [Chloroflexia bacterium]